MNWLKALLVFLQLALMVLRRLERQRTLLEGETRTMQHLIRKANELAKNAQAARSSVSDDPADRLRDKFNRDASDEDGGM